ncbi:MAG: hypothetical protein JXM70_20935 [Pirellulales bacterium]|nr:hypothetical protein [Pirellulales bacterium]
MDWRSMVWLEPELPRLEEAARTAGRNGATWDDFLEASHQALSKAVGRGAQHDELQTAEAYELARAALYTAWSKGAKSQPAPVDVQPDHFPWAAGFDEQQTFLDTSEPYR